MESVDWMAVFTGLSMGLALAATTGLRAFLPLYVVGCLGALGHLELAEGFEWMREPVALFGLGAAVLIEVAGDKLPVVDHFLDAAAVFIKPVAAMVAAASVMTELDPMLTVVIGLVLGGSLAQGVHLVKAKIRLLSSAFTATLANPFLSLIEDVLALAATLLAFLLPVLIFVLISAASVAGFWFWNQRRTAKVESS